MTQDFEAAIAPVDKPAGVRAALAALAAWGPGLLVMLADTDAGNVVAAAQAGAQWRFRLLPLILALIPALYLVQELAARLGVATGVGFGALVREKLGRGPAICALAGLALAAFGTFVTEFSAFAGIGELYGFSRGAALACAVVALLAMALTGSYKKVERAALAIGLLECAFLIVAWRARPAPAALWRDMFDPHLRNAGFLFVAAGLAGSAFNPWMVFFQQSATARRRLTVNDFSAARADTAFGAGLTQIMTGAVLVAAAATFHGGAAGGLSSIGQIGEALGAALGPEQGRLLFSLGVLGASFAAAIVASLALSWGMAEVFSPGRPPRAGLFDSRRFLLLYAVGLIAAAVAVGLFDDLVWLNIAAQIANALLFPVSLCLLILLAARALEPPWRLAGPRLAVMIALVGVIAGFGLIGLFAALS